MCRLAYQDIVQLRRDLRIEGYATLADVGFDVPWVTPYQIRSHSPDGPVLVACNWFDAPSAIEHREIINQNGGFMPGIPFNEVLDRALGLAGMVRENIYVTQAFHLLPAGRREYIPTRFIDVSFDAVTRHELLDRRVIIALGRPAQRACRIHGINADPIPHPSAGGSTFDVRAEALARLLRG